MVCILEDQFRVNLAGKADRTLGIYKLQINVYERTEGICNFVSLHCKHLLR